MERLRRSVQQSCPFGADAWMRQTAAQMGLESTLRPRGRPPGTRQPTGPEGPSPFQKNELCPLPSLLKARNQPDRFILATPFSRSCAPFEEANPFSSKEDAIAANPKWDKR